MIYVGKGLTNIKLNLGRYSSAGSLHMYTYQFSVETAMHIPTCYILLRIQQNESDAAKLNLY